MPISEKPPGTSLVGSVAKTPCSQAVSQSSILIRELRSETEAVPVGLASWTNYRKLLSVWQVASLQFSAIEDSIRISHQGPHILREVSASQTDGSKWLLLTLEYTVHCKKWCDQLKSQQTTLVFPGSTHSWNQE